MSTTKSERLAAVHERARRRFDAAYQAVEETRKQCIEDRRFTSVPGAQWEGSLGEQFANKPRFEMNKTALAVIRIINEYRNNRIDVDFASKDGSEDDKMADTCDGLYRADEQDSGAQEALDNAFEEAVTGGFGGFRLRACKEDEDDDSEHQRIRIEPIFDADSTLYFDNNAKRQDKQDAMWGFLLTPYSPDAYKDEYDDDPASWPRGWSESSYYDWNTPDIVWVAEYYEIEKRKQAIHYYRGITVGDEEPDPSDDVGYTDAELDEDKLAELAATGFTLVRTESAKRRRCHKYIMNGAMILEDCGIIAGSNVPLVPVYGKRWFVDQIERCIGHPRLAIDAQRLKNMMISSLAEIAGQFAVEKPILFPEQVLGHTEMWSSDNIVKWPYLLINPITNTDGTNTLSGPIAYTKAPTIPQALAALLQITEADLQDLLGNQQAGEEMQPNISGKVVELIQTRLDMQTAIYASNMAKAIKRGGEIWLSMAKDAYVEDGRKMKTLAADGTKGTVELNKPARDPDTNEVYAENDIGSAKFDVNVEVGPSSSSRRQATVRQLMALMASTTDPETMQVLQAMVLMNMEGEGMADIRAYYRKKLVAQGVIKPTPEEKKELEEQQANQQPDPNAAFLAASAKKALSDAALSEAKVGQTHADTIGKLAAVESGQLRDAIDLAAAISPDAGAPAGVQPQPASAQPVAQ